MKHYPFYLSHSSKSREVAAIFTSKMEQKGLSVFNPSACTETGIPYAQQVVNAISNCDGFIVLVTQDAMNSEHILNEISLAVERRKNIIPVFLERVKLSIEFNYYLGRQQFLVAAGCDEISIGKIVDTINVTFGGQIKRNALYEMLSEYQKIHDFNRKALTLCELIKLVVDEFKENENDRSRQEELARELLRLYESLATFIGGYDDESRACAKSVMETLHHAREIFSSPLFTETLYCAVLALHLIYLEYETATECVDSRTGGDVRNPFSIESRIERQAPFLAVYERHCTETGEVRTANTLSQDTLNFIKKTPSRIFAYQVVAPAKKPSAAKAAAQEKKLSGDDEILCGVAEFIEKGNELFHLLHQKGAAGDFLKCLLTSYERLKNYCVIVGATSVAAKCIEKITEIRQTLANTPEQAATDSKAENGIKTLLGITVAQSGSYDVFISFKSEDNDLAKTVYQFLKQHMIEPFWSKVSLPELSKSDYGDAIDEALDSAKHFVLVLSDLAYLESEWVKYEMSTFADEIREGRKEGSNFIILATDQVYRDLIASNKKILPIKYRWCQILHLSEYKETLLSYLK